MNAFATRAQFELIARPRASLDAAIGKARDVGYEGRRPSAPTSRGEAPQRRPPGHAKTRAWRRRAAGQSAFAVPVRRRNSTVDRARQTGAAAPTRNMRWRWPGISRTRPGISALAARYRRPPTGGARAAPTIPPAR